MAETIRETLLRRTAVFAGVLALGVPTIAAAQSTGQKEPPIYVTMYNEALDANAAHAAAAIRCDRVAMAAAVATLERLETRLGRTEKAAELAGSMATISSDMAGGYRRDVAALLRYVRKRKPQNCPDSPEPETAPTPAPQPTTQTQIETMTEEDFARLRRRDLASVYRRLSEAEIAWRNGQCESRNYSLRRALDDLGYGENRTELWNRIDELRRRPCPPGTTPVESVVDDLQPNPATIIGVPERPPGGEEAPPAPSDSQEVEGDSDDVGQALEALPRFMREAVEFALGIGEATLPTTGIGVIRGGVTEYPEGEADGGEEEFAGDTGESVATVSVEAFVEFSRFAIGGFYTEGDAATSFTIPGESGVDSGIVYGAPAPSGSSGIITPFGLTGGTETEFRNYGLEVDFSLNKRFSDAWMTASGPRLSDWRIYAGISRAERHYSGFASYSGAEPGGFVFEFSQDRRQDLDESYYRAGTTVEFAVPLGDRLISRFDVLAGGYYRHTDLESVEINLSNFGPMEDRDFINEIGDSQDGFGFEGRAGAALEFRLSPRFSILAGGSARYLSEVGAIFNPYSGDQVFFDGLTTGLRNDDAWSWRVGAGIAIGFGAAR